METESPSLFLPYIQRPRKRKNSMRMLQYEQSIAMNGGKSRKKWLPRLERVIHGIIKEEWLRLMLIASGWSHGQMSRPMAANRIPRDRKSTRLNSSHVAISYAVFY